MANIASRFSRLEDSHWGVISLYMPDVSVRAVEEKFLTPVAERRVRHKGAGRLAG